jgi:putative hydrolase of the HAD superfamily
LNLDLEKYKAVFFDVGGTLLRVYPSVGDVYVAHARPFGFAGDPAEVDRQFLREWRRSGGIESLGGHGGERAEKGFWRDVVFKVFAPFGGVRDFDAYFERVFDAFKSAEHWRVFDDVSESRILEKLRRRGVALGVISNWDSRLPTILENVGLARHFDFVLASAAVGSAKPDAGIFREALRASGVAAAAACHIGDEYDRDYLGARHAGIDAILVDRTGRFAAAPVRRIGSFGELAVAEPR